MNENGIDYKNGGGDERKIYKEKIAEKLLSLNNDNDDENKKDIKDQMFVQDIVKNKNDSKWINECYYCDLLK